VREERTEVIKTDVADMRKQRNREKRITASIRILILGYFDQREALVALTKEKDTVGIPGHGYRRCQGIHGTHDVTKGIGVGSNSLRQ